MRCTSASPDRARQSLRSVDAGPLIPQVRPGTGKAACLADGTDEQFLTFLNTFQPDENLDVGGSADRAQALTWGRIPKTYIRLADDTSLPLAIQDRLIHEGHELTPDNPYDVQTLEGGHLKCSSTPRRQPAS